MTKITITKEMMTELEALTTTTIGGMTTTTGTMTMTDDLVERLRNPTYYTHPTTEDGRLAADRIEQLTAERDEAWAYMSALQGDLYDAVMIEAERDQLREALHQIEITCDEEVCVRTAGMSEAALGKSRILPLLQIPRNIARAALKGETP